MFEPKKKKTGCCKTGCRDCPWDYKPDEESEEKDAEQPIDKSEENNKQN